MAWGNVKDDPSVGRGTRGGAESYYGDNYKGTAYGLNQPSWAYDPVMFNKTPEMWERNMAGSEPYNPEARRGGGGADWMPRGTFTNIPRQANAQANMELANRRGIASLDEDKGMGLWGHTRQALSGFDFPSLPGYMGKVADSIGKNQAQHKDLDRFFQSQDPENWRNMKNATFFGKQGFDTGNLTRQGAQARGYFNRAGITDQVLAQFMNPSYKFGGNEAWLRAQADGDKSELVDQGLSFIKNAKDTSRLHGSIMRGPAQDAAEAGMVEPGIEGRPDWDTFDTRANQNFVDVKNAMEGMSGFDIAPKADEYLGDMSLDLEPPGGYLPTEGLMPGFREPPGGYLPTEGLMPEYDKPSWLKNLGAYGWGMPGYYEHDYKFGDRNQNLDFLEDENEIMPNIADLEYFDQFR
jgi:hypothetical protein